jgi:hypothetical protein
MHQLASKSGMRFGTGRGLHSVPSVSSPGSMELRSTGAAPATPEHQTAQRATTRPTTAASLSPAPTAGTRARACAPVAFGTRETARTPPFAPLRVHFAPPCWGRTPRTEGEGRVRALCLVEALPCPGFETSERATASRRRIPGGSCQAGQSVTETIVQSLVSPSPVAGTLTACGAHQ